MAVEATKQTPVVQTPPVAVTTIPQNSTNEVKKAEQKTSAVPTEANKENIPTEQGKKLDVIA